MGNFAIKIKDEKIRECYGMTCCIGEIQIGKFKEEFEMSLEGLTIDDYKKQWKAGLQRIQTHTTSCLVSEFENSGKYPRVIMWVLYKEGEKIYIRNIFLCDKRFLKMLKKQPFTLENCYEFITPREPSLGAMPVSEWVTDLASINEFLVKNEQP